MTRHAGQRLKIANDPSDKLTSATEVRFLQAAKRGQEDRGRRKIRKTGISRQRQTSAIYLTCSRADGFKERLVHILLRVTD